MSCWSSSSWSPSSTLLYGDAVEMEDRAHLLWEAQCEVIQLEKDLMTMTSQGAAEADRERLYLLLEAAKDKVALRSHNLMMGRGQIGSYGRLII